MLLTTHRQTIQQNGTTSCNGIRTARVEHAGTEKNSEFRMFCQNCTVSVVQELLYKRRSYHSPAPYYISLQCESKKFYPRKLKCKNSLADLLDDRANMT